MAQILQVESKVNRGRQTTQCHCDCQRGLQDEKGIVRGELLLYYGDLVTNVKLSGVIKTGAPWPRAPPCSCTSICDPDTILTTDSPEN